MYGWVVMATLRDSALPADIIQRQVVLSTRRVCGLAPSP